MQRARSKDGPKPSVPARFSHFFFCKRMQNKTTWRQAINRRLVGHVSAFVIVPPKNVRINRAKACSIQLPQSAFDVVGRYRSVIRCDPFTRLKRQTGNNELINGLRFKEFHQSIQEGLFDSVGEWFSRATA